MRQASVGFQCPECVNRGAKETRSGRAAYGGARSGNPAITTIGLIATNLLVWLAVMATGAGSSSLVSVLGLHARGRCEVDDGSGFYRVPEQVCSLTPEPSTWYPGVSDGAYWQLITSAFLHVEIWHIAFNLLALWFLGPLLEQALGRTRFLTVYLGSCLTGSVVVYWLAHPEIVTLGASGGVFGLMAALLVLAHKSRSDVSQILTWIGINVVITVVWISSISWQGHLGGFVGGLLLTGLIAYAPRRHRGTWQLVGCAALGVVLVAATIARTLSL